MPGRKPSYLPITSVVVAIVILVIAVGLTSFRDVSRGRRHVEDVLGRQARLIMVSLGASLRAGIAAPDWQAPRLEALLAEAAYDRDIAYLSILDSDGRVLVHSDADKVGSVWTEGISDEIPRPGDRLSGEVLIVDGRRVYQADVLFDPLAPMPGMRRPRARGLRWPPREEDQLFGRLSELLGREVNPGDEIGLRLVVGLDMSDIESAFLTSRNHTIMLSGVLLLVGGAAIYFLFIVQHYRSTRTALANMRSYTTNVIESMPSGLVSLDAGGNVVTLNSTARSLLGVTETDVKGRPIDEVVSIKAEPGRAAVEDIVGGRESVLETDARMTVGDRTIPVALSASSLRDEDGKRAGTVLLFQDQREVEALKAEVERERHLASLGRLSAGVAHEIRNPLSSLKGFAQFLRSRFQPGSQEERYSDIMIEEVERLDRVVQELLDFAKPNEPARVASSANTIADDALSLLSEDAAFRNVEIRREFAAGLPDVLVDPNQIMQAILNVLLNGIEAMPEGGVLTVRTSVSRNRRGPAYVSVVVSDTGEGMDEEQLSKLYEPFYTTKQGGTGLGLTIVSRVLEQNGGHVEVTSVKRGGTAFSLRLPLEDREQGDSNRE